LTAIARNMAPNSSIAQNTSADMAVQREPTRAPQMMADGGILEMNEGGGLSGLLQGIFGFGRGDEDIGRPVQPYPENSPNPRDRSTWMRMYGETHNLDGSPKSMSPNTAMTEMNQGIGNVSADVGDFTPTVPGAAQDPSTDLDIGGILAGAQQFDFDRPFAQQDTTSGLPVAAPDFDATNEEDFLDAESERLDQLDIAAANMGDRPLPDVSQIDPETNLDMSAALGIGSLGTNLADAINNQPTDPTISSASAQQPSLEEQLADSLGFAVDADQRNQLLERLEQLDTPPPSVLASQANADGTPTNSDELMQYLASLKPRFQGGAVPGGSFPTGAMYNPTVPGSFPNDAELAGEYPSYSTLSGDNFINDPNTGYPYPTDVPPLDPTEDEMLNASGATDASYPSKGMVAPKADELRYDDPDLSKFLTPPPTSDNQSRFIPEMPIGADSVMPPIMDTGGAGGGTGSDSYSGLESRIAQMLADREKSAQSDKWLALAQAGMALMASDSPTLGGAIGEAGLVGISQMRDAKSQYDKEVLELLGTQADIDDARRGRDLESQELALERDQLNQTIASDKALSDYRMASLTPRGASISDLQAGLSYLNGEIQTQATIIGTDEFGEQVEQIDMTKVDPQLLVQKKSLEDALLARINKSGTDFDATGS